MQQRDPTAAGIVFGQFRLDPTRRLLEKSGVAVPVSSRAFDILVLLATERDRVVGRAEIIAQVWPDVIVDEHNLSVQVSVLRRALGDSGDDSQIIATVPGRGYRFVAEICEPAEETVPEPAEIAALSPQENAAVLAPPTFARRRAVAIALVAAIVLLPLIALRFHKAGTAAPVLSLVVLPFRNLSDEGVQPHLADVISDDLTTNLAHIPGSIVIASDTADTYRGSAVPVTELARRLHIRYIVDGSIRVDGDALRVNAQLIDGGTGAHLWARHYETKVGSLAQTQADIARQIASALDAKLLEVEATKSTELALAESDVLDLFVRARDIFEHRDTLQGLTEAQHLLERALALKPDNGLVLGQLSLVLNRKLQSYDDPQDAADMQQLRQVIQHALELDARNVGALVARGRMLTNWGHYEDARSNMQTALQVDPNNVLALAGLAYVAWRAGDPQTAIGPLQTVLRIDPESGQNRNRLFLLGASLFMAGLPAEAIPHLRLAVAGDPGSQADGDLGRSEFCNLFLIAAQWLGGEKAEGRVLLKSYMRHWPRRSVWRLGSYFTLEQRSLPQFERLMQALTDAGLPAVIDERADYGVPAPRLPVDGGDFDPTPTEWPGGRTIQAASVASEVDHGAFVVDVGAGRKTLPNAIVPKQIDPEGDPVEVAERELVRRAHKDGAPVIVMGDGVVGWQSYNAALQLSARGYKDVAWFRGGEEVWSSLQPTIAAAR